SRREKARALQFLKAGQIPDLLQGEMIEEFFRSAVSYRASWRFAPAPHLHPLRFKQRVQRTLGGLDPSNVLDLRTRDGLVIGNDRKHLQRSTRKLLLLHRVPAHEERQVAGSAERPGIANAHEVDAAPRIDLLQF